MLAATHTKPELLGFPIIASPKIDGVRCVIFDGVAYSRTLKPIPNRAVQKWAKANAFLLDGLDGELVVGPATAPNVMQATTSGVMRKDGEPDFAFHAFDFVPLDSECFSSRAKVLERHLYDETLPSMFYVPHRLIQTHDELNRYERECLALGYEGVMLRDPEGGYKFGRSTERERGLVKLKRFSDAEAIVIGFEEEMHNGNEATRDALGRTGRSSTRAGLVGKGTLGALQVRGNDGQVFNIGTGFTAEQRVEIWRDHPAYFGSTVKYKYFAHGVKDAPRHPVFIGFRHKEDM
jgi:DNA ligase-1